MTSKSTRLDHGKEFKSNSPKAPTVSRGIRLKNQMTIMTDLLDEQILKNP